MRRYQLSVRNYSQQKDNAAKYIKDDFDTLDEVYEHIREELLGNYNFTCFESKKDFIETERKVKNYSIGELKFPLILRDDDLLISFSNKVTNDELLDFSAENENYIKIYDLLDSDDLLEVHENTDFFDTDENGVFELYTKTKYYYLDDFDGRIKESRELSQDSFETALIYALDEIFKNRYAIVGSGVYDTFASSGLEGYIDSIFYTDDEIEKIPSVDNALCDCLTNSGAVWLVCGCPDDEEEAKGLLKEGLISSAQFCKYMGGFEMYSLNGQVTYSKKELFEDYYFDDLQKYIACA